MDSTIDREYISRYGQPTFGIVVHKAGVPADADGNDVEVVMKDADGDTIFTRTADRTALGTYSITLTSADTQTPGVYDLDWSYATDTTPQVFGSFFEVGPTQPAYDALPAELKLVVEQSWVRFADLWDSPDGGPHLQVYFQTHFGRNRLAQLLALAVGRLNTVAQPHQTYGIDDTNPFPVASWGPLLEQALYVEVVKHLRRSYVEQPVLSGVGGIATLDRRDYLARWGEILRDEQADLKSMLNNFKIANMGLGQSRVLVGGGVYGNYGPSRLPGSAAARPRYYYAFAA